MNIQNLFDIGDLVYLKHDPEQHLRQVTALVVYSETDICYRLQAGVSWSDHFDFEISTDKRIQ
jgi:hypothetical protein